MILYKFQSVHGIGVNLSLSRYSIIKVGVVVMIIIDYILHYFIFVLFFLISYFLMQKRLRKR